MIQKYNPQDFIKEFDLDLAVIGGGVAGVVTAVAAARQGLKVGLMQNRPVYGGPSSSECNSANEGDRLHVNGAADYWNRNARETGIIEEMKLEFFRRIDDGWYNHWSIILRDFVKREKQIVSFLNCEAYEVQVENDKITQVKGRLIGSETTVIFNAPLFVDATGDSFVAAAAGADFRMGREAREEFNESLAPETADEYTQGNTILFRAKDMGKPTKYVPPEWAMKFHNESDLPYRLHNNPAYGYWWLESGGTENTIRDNEKIYDDLMAALFGVWDHLKNHGNHGADNYVINWISPFAGKRESRRLMGDYILTQSDIMSQKSYPDQVAYGGWPIDIHAPQGIRGKSHPGSTPPFEFPGVYPIPFRCLYSRNIQNLMMPGRNISASHVALGSTRVMATCAVCGQAVGIAAAICHKNGVLPRELGERYIHELQFELFKNDQSLPDMRFKVNTDFAVSASSSMPFEFPDPDSAIPLLALPKSSDDPCDVPPGDRTRAQLFPVATEFIDSVKIYINNHNPAAIELKVTLFIPASHNDFCGKEIAADVQMVSPGDNQPVEFVFNNIPVKSPLAGIRFEPVTGVDIKTVICALPGAYMKADGCYVSNRNIYCEVSPPQYVYNADNVLSGLNRTSDKPEMWISRKELPQSLYFNRQSTRHITEIEIIFDTNLNVQHPRGCVPQCVKDYEIIVDDTTIIKVTDNYQRRRLHPVGMQGKSVEIRITSTNGDESARVYSVNIH